MRLRLVLGTAVLFLAVATVGLSVVGYLQVHETGTWLVPLVLFLAGVTFACSHHGRLHHAVTKRLATRVHTLLCVIGFVLVMVHFVVGGLTGQSEVAIARASLAGACIFVLLAVLSTVAPHNKSLKADYRGVPRDDRNNAAR